MSRPGPNCKPRTCKLCGESFVPTSSRQSCCGRDIEVPCAFCGELFTKKCTTSDTTKCCSEKCTIEYMKLRRSENSRAKKKICKWCGREFYPSHARVVYCDGPHFKKCEVCGKEFELDVKFHRDRRSCSDECLKILQVRDRDFEKEHENMKKVLESKYGPGVDNPMKITGVQEKQKLTNRIKYGVDWYTQTQEYRDRAKKTSIEKYGVEHWLSNRDIIKKREETCELKYGSNNVFSSEYGKSKVIEHMKSTYGVVNPSQVPELRKKAIKNARISSLETRVATLLEEYNISYIHHYSISNQEEQQFHEFDFYLQDYKILIDCDGLYYHSYLNDPDGKHVLDYYDETRLSLIPDDHIFHVIVEGQEDKDVKNLVKILENIDSSIFDYEGYIFNWCRSIEFPYPTFEYDRMKLDYSSLCKYHHETYKSTARMGESLCKQFHKSIYTSNVHGFVSPVEAWYDDKLLKKVIKNRLIYVNNVNPSKILSGFNISKICPRVSIFNPVLAKYLVEKYLSAYDTVFDPFSGFSGRMLGTVSTCKKYVGQDLNETAVKEANEIIEFLDLANASVEVSDILDSSGIYPCLLTCPPYGIKEHYSDESVFKTCDEWIDEILSRFKCNRYVFVVDKTTKYQDFIKEEIKSTSHFVKVKELVIVM